MPKILKKLFWFRAVEAVDAAAVDAAAVDVVVVAAVDAVVVLGAFVVRVVSDVLGVFAARGVSDVEAASAEQITRGAEHAATVVSWVAMLALAKGIETARIGSSLFPVRSHSYRVFSANGHETLVIGYG